MMSSDRKDQHIALALKQEKKSNDFDYMHLLHDNLSGLNVDHIHLETKFLGFDIPYPIYINAMTGGSQKAAKINAFLAKLAYKYKLPMVLGSQSIALKDESFVETFNIVRTHCPQGILVANISANTCIEDAKKAIEMIDAQALSVHLNMLQELVMKEGDRYFSHWYNQIKDYQTVLKVPILVKEVGFGLTRPTLKKLEELGIKYVDISGKGGTDFLHIENDRRKGHYDYLSGLGISTLDALQEASKGYDFTYYASGGIRNPLDVIKSLVLGAQAVGLSQFFLKLTQKSFDEACGIMDIFLDDLKKIMVLLGAKRITDLKKIPYQIK